MNDLGPPLNGRLAGERLEINSKRLVFIPVSNNQPNPHWALLVFDVLEGSFDVFDSSVRIFSANSEPRGVNYDFAVAVARNFWKVFGTEMACPIPYQQAQCPQQTNAVDGGMFMVMMAEFVAGHLNCMNSGLDIHGYVNTHAVAKQVLILL